MLGRRKQNAPWTRRMSRRWRRWRCRVRRATGVRGAAPAGYLLRRGRLHRGSACRGRWFQRRMAAAGRGVCVANGGAKNRNSHRGARKTSGVSESLLWEREGAENGAVIGGTHGPCLALAQIVCAEAPPSPSCHPRKCYTPTSRGSTCSSIHPFSTHHPQFAPLPISTCYPNVYKRPNSRPFDFDRQLYSNI